MRRVGPAVGAALTLGLVLLTATPNTPPARAAAAPPVCDAPRYHGLRHCVHQLGSSLIHALIVDLTDPAISFRLALPARETPWGTLECYNTRLCGDGLYPFESVPQMLARQATGGAVAGINTDYFGLSSHPDHGAEGIAVRDGARLDNARGQELVGRTSLSISRTNQARLLWVGPRNTPLDLGGLDFTVAGGGPQIVSEGQPLDNTACLAERLAEAACARQFHSAAGLRDGGRTLVLAVARDLDAAGVAAFLAAEYEVTEALKFDGGGSAQLAWLDPAGQVTGFDASGSTDGGFRRVAEGLLVFSQPLPVALTGVFPGIVVDDAAPAFQRLGAPANWRASLGGGSQASAFQWTRNRTRAEMESGQWTLAVREAGRYQAFVFIPAGQATTRSARYEVGHGGGVTLVAVDQWANRGRWVLLGEFDLEPGGANYVRLSDMTGEAFGTTQVAFDAVGLVRVR